MFASKTTIGDYIPGGGSLVYRICVWRQRRCPVLSLKIHERGRSPLAPANEN